MNTRKMTLEEIRVKGLEALADKLGPAGMLRFLQMFDKGTGNYSEDRHTWLTGTDPETVVTEILNRKKHSTDSRE